MGIINVYKYLNNNTIKIYVAKTGHNTIAGCKSRKTTVFIGTVI